MLAIVSALALIRTCPFAPATRGTSPSDASALPAGAVKWERLDPASIGGKFADGAIAIRSCHRDIGARRLHQIADLLKAHI